MKNLEVRLERIERLERQRLSESTASHLAGAFESFTDTEMVRLLALCGRAHRCAAECHIRSPDADLLMAIRPEIEQVLSERNDQ